MKVEFCNKKFAEIKSGGVFVCTPNSETLIMKINPCKEGEKSVNAVRLCDGQLFQLDEIDEVYPVNCYIMRNA